MGENSDRISDCLHSPLTRSAMQELFSERKNRIAGMLAGNAIGDMLGLSRTGQSSLVEAKRPAAVTMQSIPSVSGGGEYALPAGFWTDDTAMMLALCTSLTETGGEQDSARELMHYRKWLFDGAYTPDGKAVDIGKTTRQAVTTGVAPMGERDCGNGALMRSSPLAAFSLSHTDTHTITAAAESCAVTHAHPLVISVNSVYVLLLKKLLLGYPLGDAIRLVSAQLPDAASVLHLPAEYRPTGYCVDTLRTALAAVTDTGTFAEAVWLAVSLGGDADTVAAVTGAVAGAIYGYDGIPEEWQKHTARGTMIRELMAKAGFL